MDSAGLAGAPPARCRLLGLAAALAALIADRRPFVLARKVYEQRMCGNRRGLKFKKKEENKKTRKETTNL
jgi:hypothetical protein